MRTLGDQRSCDLPGSSVLHQIESTYGFTPLTITVGTSYFRRLAASNQAMLQVSASHPSFIGLVRGLTFEEPGKPLVGAIHAPYLSNEVWLTLIHLTCTYIAAKSLANAPLRCTLRAIISHIYGVEPCAIDLELSSDLEIQCLEALDWRLGPVVQQEEMSYAADRRLPVSPVTCNQESGMYDPALSSASKYALTDCTCRVAFPSKSQGVQYCCNVEQSVMVHCTGNHETRDPALSWVAGKEPSAVSVERDEPVLAELSHALSRTQGTSAQSKSAISKLERSIYAWHQHRTVQWSWTLASIFLMFLLTATRFNTYFMAAAFVPCFLGQQTASWGLALTGWGLDTQKSMAKWFFKASKQCLVNFVPSCAADHISLSVC